MMLIIILTSAATKRPRYGLDSCPDQAQSSACWFSGSFKAGGIARDNPYLYCGWKGMAGALETAEIFLIE